MESASTTEQVKPSLSQTRRQSAGGDLFVAARPELAFARLDSASRNRRTRWSVFDPVARRSFRIGEAERRILSKCREFRPVAGVVGDVHREEPSWDLAELQRIVLGLIANGLIRHRSKPNNQTASGDTAALNDSIDLNTQPNTQRVGIIKRMGAGLSSSIVWQVRGINPDHALKVIAPHFDWLYSKAAAVCWLVFALVTWMAVCLDFQRLIEFAGEVSWFGTIEFTGALFLVFLLTRCLHEFGHAVVCRRMGVRCPDVGFLVILGAPCLYCDVTECAKLPSRYQRAAVAAAGMYTELVLASVCAWAWLLTDAGPANTFALQIMLVCSVSTLLINANPLMRFDGYYILADWLDEVNLRSKADRMLSSAASRLLSGCRSEGQDEPLHAIDGGRRWFFLSFSAAGWAYRSVLTVAIASTVYILLAGWNLPWMGRFLAASIFFSWWGLPVIGFFRKATSAAWSSGRRFRPVFGLVALLVAIGLLPIPTRHFAQGNLRPREASTVYAHTESTLVAVGTFDGQHVAPGQVLFRLQDPGLTQQYVSRVADWNNSKLRLEAARHRRNMHREDYDLRPIEEQSQMLGRLAEHTQSELKRLEIQSPAKGIFRANVALPPDGANTAIKVPRGSQWSDTIQLGRTVPAGTALGQVCSDDAVAIVPLSDSQQRSVIPGTSVKLRIPGAPPRVFNAEVSKVVELQAIASSDNLHANVAATDVGAGRYAAMIPLPQVDGGAFIRDQRVDVVFHCPSRTPLQIAQQWAHRHLRFFAQ